MGVRIFIFSHCEGGAFLRRPQQSIDRRSACAPVYGSPRRYATDVARLVMTKEWGSVGGIMDCHGAHGTGNGVLRDESVILRLWIATLTLFARND